MVSLHEEEEEPTMEDKRNNEAQRPLTRRNPKRYIPLVGLLLWRKLVAVHPFVWTLGLQLWLVSEAVHEMKF